ncbi:MAG: N-acetylmuramoyl-L-alanine amidase [Kiritimatiellae bacterium]|nr:N-acetylmuramoyl-L-alanine amidase [Kiritimatiellia bacterium]
MQQVIGATNYTWNGDSLSFSNSQHNIRFYQGRRKADVDGTTVWLNIQPNGSVPGGDWRLGAVDLDLFQLCVLPQAEGNPKPLRILLDPGHGGDDNGACSENPPLKEKELTLALAKRIAGHLKKAGLHVDLTRTRDSTLTLAERVRLARKKKADIFLSIHANHAGNTEATGVETYVLPPSGYPGTAEGSRPRGWQIGNRNDYHNTLLGFSIHSKLAVQTNATDRGLKRQSFFVLRETGCPAVLLEFGFLSNRGETLRMLTSSWQEQCAAAVTAGVTAYAKRLGALDQAVAEKRARDAEANERWRRHLASVKTNAPPLTPVSPPLPEPVATNPTYAASSPSAFFRGTNTAPAEVNTLIDFYTTGTLE